MNWAATYLIKQAVRQAPNWWKHRPVSEGSIPTDKEREVLRRHAEAEAKG
jgi:hypothetical protein